MFELLETQAENIIEEATRRVACARLKHYTAAGEAVMRQRHERLFALVVQVAVTRKVAPLLEWADTIARERYEGAYDLYEVQMAINVLEEVIWQALQRGLDPERFIEAISAISTVLGQAKDAVARSYVRLALEGGPRRRDLDNLWGPVAAGRSS